LRYYEQQGLLTSSRTSGGQRLYGEEAVEDVRLIRQLLNAGLTVRVIKALVPCADRAAADREAAMKDVVRQRDRIAGCIERMRNSLDALDRLVATYAAKNDSGDTAR
jgi:DNA-binding transcriptional MerR regulator